ENVRDRGFVRCGPAFEQKIDCVSREIKFLRSERARRHRGNGEQSRTGLLVLFFLGRNEIKDDSLYSAERLPQRSVNKIRQMRRIKELSFGLDKTIEDVEHLVAPIVNLVLKLFDGGGAKRHRTMLGDVVIELPAPVRILIKVLNA